MCRPQRVTACSVSNVYNHVDSTLLYRRMQKCACLCVCVCVCVLMCICSSVFVFENIFLSISKLVVMFFFCFCFFSRNTVLVVPKLVQNFSVCVWGGCGCVCAYINTYACSRVVWCLFVCKCKYVHVLLVCTCICLSVCFCMCVCACVCLC